MRFSKKQCQFLANQRETCSQAAHERYEYCLQHLREITAENIKQLVFSVISEQLGTDPEMIAPNDHLLDDLSADSLDVLELVLTFQEILKIKVPDEDVEKMSTVQSVISYLTATLFGSEAYITTKIQVESSVGRENKPLNQPDTLRLVSRIVNSEFFSHYFRGLKLAPEKVNELLIKVLEGRWIHHVTTVPVFNNTKELVGAHVFLLSGQFLFRFYLSEMSIQFGAVDIKNLYLDYRANYDEHGTLREIQVAPKAPAHLEGEKVTFNFADLEGIRGALEFLRKFLKNVEERHG